MNSLSRLVIASLSALLAGAFPLSASATEEPAQPAAGDNAAGMTLVVGDIFGGKTKLESSGQTQGKVSVNHLVVGVGQTITKELSVGFNYKIVGIDLEQNNSTIALPARLRSISLGLNYAREIAPSWTGVLLVNPGWNTTTEGSAFASKGFGVTTGIGVRREISPTLKATIGLAYNTLATHHYRFLPFSALEWKPSEDWTVSLGLPQTGVSYAVTKQFHVAWVVQGNGGTYYVAKDPLPGDLAKPSLDRSKLEFTEILTGFAASYSVTQRTFVSVSSGLVVYRRFDYRDVGYRLTSRNTAPYITATFSFGF